MKPDADVKLTKETPFHQRMAASTRNFIEYRGYWLAVPFQQQRGDRRILGGTRGVRSSPT